MGKSRAPPKGNGNCRVEDCDPTIKKPNGCPCPGLKGCLIGFPVCPGEESITLLCSATSCPFSGTPIHKPCFEKYEDQLLKTLGEKGSARGWTDYKARRNLWRPSGQGLIVMHCRCLCQKGNVCPPEEVVLAERILVAPLDGERKKKKKKRDLPVINMNGGANAKQAIMQARFEREEMIEDERNLGREFHTPPFTPRRTRNNSVTSFSSHSIVSTSSIKRRIVSSSFDREEEGNVLRGRRNEGRRGGKKREESRARLDSGVSLRTPTSSPLKENSSPLLPAATPPPMTRSYADTITLPPVPSSSSSVSLSTAVDFSTNPPLYRNSHVNINNLKLMAEVWYTRCTPQWEIVSWGLYDPWILRSHDRSDSSSVSPSSPSSPSSLDHMNTPGWNPWEGQKFEVGELTIGGARVETKKEG